MKMKMKMKMIDEFLLRSSCGQQIGGSGGRSADADKDGEHEIIRQRVEWIASIPCFGATAAVFIFIAIAPRLLNQAGRINGVRIIIPMVVTIIISIQT